jgi:hypothetical protein
MHLAWSSENCPHLSERGVTLLAALAVAVNLAFIWLVSVSAP